MSLKTVIVTILAQFLSLTSSLNMEYVNYLTDAVGIDSANRKLSYQLYSDNNVMNIFKSLNYTLVNSHPFSDYLTFQGLEICASNPFRSPFLTVFLDTTILHPILKTIVGLYHTDHILCQFSELSTLHNSTTEPFFAYVHILLPHAPYVFGPAGEIKEIQRYDTKITQKHKLGYIDQVQFANKKIIETIDKILLESNSPPIIILQGDHGTQTLLKKYSANWDNKNDESVTERMSILNAYYLPDQNTGLIYDSITPVNSFRLILNTHFNTNYELLEDKSYFAYYAYPYHFTDITKILLTNSTQN